MPQTFDAQSTADNVLEGLDLSGKRVLVTGTSAGIGVETARSLVAHGANVVGAVRDLDKARRATDAAGVGKEGKGSFELVQLDLGNLANVRACADGLLADGRTFDLVIANAGIMACPQGQTADGFEIQLGTNHLGHFVLVNRLVPLLRTGARLVNVSSAGHRFADVDLDDPNFEHTPYAEFVAYGRSKTANILFAVEFDRRHKAAGVRGAVVHPGAIQTELSRYMTPEVTRQMISAINTANREQSAPLFAWKTIPQGAATTLWAGVRAGADEVGGKYCEDCHVAELIADPQVRGGVRPYAIDPDHAKALWAKSQEMVGEVFG